MRRVAIVGSREFPDMGLVWRFVRHLPQGSIVVSGGARGVDSAAASAARSCGLTCVEYVANWDRLGKRAGFVRNLEIIADCDEVHAFWDGKSRGTKHTIDKAREAGKPVTVYINGATVHYPPVIERVGL